jgi:hypothetical protein
MRLEITEKQLAQAISHHPGSSIRSIPAVMERKRRIERLERKLLCPYCANLAAYDLKPAEDILRFTEWDGLNWFVPKELETPVVIRVHYENHPHSWRPEFFVPCGEGPNDTRPDMDLTRNPMAWTS